MIALLVLTPAARAAGFGAIAGPGGCLDESGVTPAKCGAGTGVVDPAAVAVSPDGTSVYVVGGTWRGSPAESFGSIATLQRDPATGEVKDVGCISSDGTDGRDGASGACAQSASLLGADGVAVSPDGRTVFVTSSGSASVAAFTRDPATGLLTRLGCFQMAPLPGCRSASLFRGSSNMIASPDGSALYVASPLEGAISELTAVPPPTSSPPPPAGGEGAGAPGGQTTSAAGTGVASLFGPSPSATLSDPCIAVNGWDGGCAVGLAMKGVSGLTLSPDGKQLYAAAQKSRAIDVFAPPEGEPLAEVGCLMADAPHGLCNSSARLTGPTQLAISPDGRSVYVADGDQIEVLTREAATGKLADDGCVDLLPEPVKHEPGEEHEEEGEGEGGKEPPSPPDPCTSVPGLVSVIDVAVSGDGSAVYAFGSSSVVSFARNAATGALTETGCASNSDTRCASMPNLEEVQAAAVSPDGHNVYVITHGTNAVLAFGVGASVTATSASATPAGTARVSVACPAHLRRACSGRIVLTRRIAVRARRARRSHRRVGAGASRTFAIAPGHRSVVSVRLYRSARGVLLGRHRLGVVATVRASRMSGGSGLGRRMVLHLARR